LRQAEVLKAEIVKLYKKLILREKFMLPLRKFVKLSFGAALFFALGLPKILLFPEPSLAQIPATTTITPSISPSVQTIKIIYVAPNGSDSNLGVSVDLPLRSLTAALKQKPQAGTIIQLADGTYTAESGEQFPIKIPSGVIIRGNPSNQGKDVIISGGDRFISPTFARQNIALLAGDNSRIEGVTLTNANARGYGLWVESAKNVTITSNTFTKSTHDGIFLTGTATANIISNIFIQNRANGISVVGTSSVTVQSNTFYDTGFGLAIGQKSQATVLANRITHNRSGIIVSNLSTPTFRNNLIADNKENGLVVLKDRKGQPTVDLGTTTTIGENIFQNNKQFDLNNASGVKLIAIGNQADPKRVQGAIELIIPKTPLTPPTTPEPIIPVVVVIPQSKTTPASSTIKTAPQTVKPTPSPIIQPLPINIPITNATPSKKK
jgi:parallel beta-helix repeat protein